MRGNRIKSNTSKLGRREEMEANEGRMGDALALDDDEGRGKLRKAAGRCKQSPIRRCPNGETRQVEDLKSKTVTC
jgi:hypothetical protein